MRSIYLAILEENGANYVKGVGLTSEAAINTARSGFSWLFHRADEYNVVEVKTTNTFPVDESGWKFLPDTDPDSVKRWLAEVDARETAKAARRTQAKRRREEKRKRKAEEAERARQREHNRARWIPREMHTEHLSRWQQEVLEELRRLGCPRHEQAAKALKCDELRLRGDHELRPYEAVQLVRDSERLKAWAEGCRENATGQHEAYRTWGGDSAAEKRIEPDYGYSYEDEDQWIMSLSPGDEVRHPTFGVGTVLSVEPLTDDMRLTIRFRDVGRKTLRASFAKLTLA